MTTATQNPVRAPGVWLRQSGGENIVFDPTRGVAHTMNTTAVAIWVLCDGDTHPSEMMEAICEISGLPITVVQEDVERILEEFESVGVIEWHEDVRA
jgi:hypothetical protein